MPTPVPFSTLPPSAQFLTCTLSGAAISESLPARLAGKVPATLSFAPEGYHAKVPADRIVHLVGSEGHEAYHCTAPALVQGPALYWVETPAQLESRTGQSLSTGAVRRTRLLTGLAQRAVVAALLLGIAFLLTLVTIGTVPDDTLGAITQAGRSAIDTGDFAPLKSVADNGIEGENSLLLMIAAFTLSGLLMGLSTITFVIGTLCTRLYHPKSITRAFPPALAHAAGLADHDTPAHLDASALDVRAIKAVPNPLNIMVPDHLIQPSITVDKAITGVSAGRPQQLLRVEQGETYTIDPGHIITYRVPKHTDSRGHSTPAHWRHMHCLSSAVVQGPAVIGTQPAPIPSFSTFVATNPEEGGNGFVAAGSLILFFGGLLLLAAIVSEVRQFWGAHPINWGGPLVMLLLIGGASAACWTWGYRYKRVRITF